MEKGDGPLEKGKGGTRRSSGVLKSGQGPKINAFDNSVARKSGKKGKSKDPNPKTVKKAKAQKSGGSQVSFLYYITK